MSFYYLLSYLPFHVNITALLKRKALNQIILFLIVKLNISAEKIHKLRFNDDL